MSAPTKADLTKILHNSSPKTFLGPKKWTKIPYTPLHALTRYTRKILILLCKNLDTYTPLHALTRFWFLQILATTSPTQEFLEKARAVSLPYTPLHAFFSAHAHMQGDCPHQGPVVAQPAHTNMSSRLTQPWQAVPDPSFRQCFSGRACVRRTCCCATCRDCLR